MVIRSLDSHVDGFPITLHPNQRSAARALVDSVEAEEADECIDSKMHNLLYSLFSDLPDNADEDQYLCPVLRFLVLYCLRQDGRFLRPSEITPITASISWTMRATVLREAMEKKAVSGESFPLKE